MASMAEGAVAPAASTSSTSSQSPSVTSSSCWSQLSVAAALDIYNFFGLGAYYFVAADNAFQQAAAAAAAYDPQPPRVKRRKIEVEESTTRLFDGKRNGRSSGVVTFKPYSDIRLDSSLNSSGLRTGRELQLPLKRRHGHDGLSHIPTQKGSVVKNTQVIQPDRGCTIGNLFPEILSMIFEYLDVQSKGRVAQVRTEIGV